jgi:hypothetical protein
MSIRLLQAIFLAGVFTDVDGATLTLSPAQESDLVAQGKAVYVADPLQVTRQTVLRDDLASLGVRGVNKRSRSPAALFGGSTMSLAQVSIVSGSPTLSIEVDAKGRKRLKVVTGSGVAAQLSFSPLVNAYFGGDAYAVVQGSYEDGLSAFSAYFAPGATVATNYVLSGSINFAAAVANPFLQPGAGVEPFTWRTGKKNNAITGSISYPFVAGSHKLVITPRAGMVATVYIYAIGVGAKNPKGRCFVMADDGMASWFGIGAPLFNEAGIPTTGALIASAVGLSATYGTREQWQAYVGAGNVVIAHGPNGAAYDQNLINSFTTNEKRLDDMNVAREFIEKNGLWTPHCDMCYAWPQGAYQTAAGDTSLLVRAMAEGFRIARCSAQPNALVQFNADAATSLQRLTLPYSTHGWAGTTGGQVALTAALVQAIDDAATYGTDVFVTFHAVVPDSTADGSMDSSKCRVSDLLTIRDAIAAKVAAGTLECGVLTDLAYGGVDTYWAQF